MDFEEYRDRRLEESPELKAAYEKEKLERMVSRAHTLLLGEWAVIQSTLYAAYQLIKETRGGEREEARLWFDEALAASRLNTTEGVLLRKGSPETVAALCRQIIERNKE